MRQMLNLMTVAFFAVLLVSCGDSSAKEEKAGLGDRKVKLEKLKKEQETINKQITELEKEIEAIDPSSATKPKLVALTTIGTDTFSHYIDLQGKIDAKNVAYVAPRNGGGTVKAIFVTQGQSVRKGQMILKMDDAVARQNVTTAQQQIAGAEAQYKLQQSIYERRLSLWKQNIGSEVGVLEAKTNADAAASQLSTAKSAVALAQEQANQSNVYAEMSGTVDQVNVRVGEFFTGTAGDGKPQISIVNTGDLKVLAQVPENYLGRIKQGTALEVSLPEAGNKSFSTKVSVVGRLIDPNSRSFYVEGSIPTSVSKDFRPNQIAMVRIRDYATPNAITIPVNTLQNDEKGKYVMVAVKEGEKLVARKRQVAVGELYGDKLEVKSGLNTGDVLVIEGFQNLYEGQLITTEVK